MKRCEHCRYADWQRTEKGRLHPSGDGRCTVKIEMPVLPQSMYWLSHPNPPQPYGGCINRKEELKDHCPRYAPRSEA